MAANIGGVMSTRGRPIAAIEPTDTERETLQRLVRRHGSAQALALRSRIVRLRRGNDQPRGGRSRACASGDRVEMAAASYREPTRR